MSPYDKEVQICQIPFSSQRKFGSQCDVFVIEIPCKADIPSQQSELKPRQIREKKSKYSNSPSWI